MDITKTVVQGRDQALLYGDYSTYHRQLSKRIANCRKKIGIATRNRGKFQRKDDPTAQDVAENQEYVRLLLLASERTWAQSMSFKASHSNSRKITGRTRSHIVSRLTKGAHTAEHLVSILSEADVSGATTTDILEAKAYAALIKGAAQFEKQDWEPCLGSYAKARVIYSALATQTQSDLFKDLLSETIDPSIRFAAYQTKTPRTVPIPVIARKAFPQSDPELVKEIDRIDPSILKQGDEESRKDTPSAEGAPKTLTWRSREVKIEDAQIAMAWGAVLSAKDRLAQDLADPEGRQPHELAGAYDEILTLTQDAVDATKQAIDEMRHERVDHGDPRMQSLQITRTAVNFETISWRIGRNRVLTGPRDGATEEYGPLRRKKIKAEEEGIKQEKDLPPGKKLTKLKEKVALYDGTLQNIESIKELPGVANDQVLAGHIDSYVKYFQALKALAIGRSHAIGNKPANALALIHHAYGLVQEALSSAPEPQGSTEGPLNLVVAPEAIDSLSTLLDGELQRHRAIVHIDNLRREARESSIEVPKQPLVERLHDFPMGGVDLTNVVKFPPTMDVIPVKPIFLDVAWNYIDYPGKSTGETAAPARSERPKQQPSQEEAKQPAKKGWFGFGRS